MFDLASPERGAVMGVVVPEHQEVSVRTGSQFWRGMGLPVGAGLGGSIVSLTLLAWGLESGSNVIFYPHLQEHGFESETILMLTMHAGHLIVWPSLSIWFIFKGRNLNNPGLGKGALVSMLLYVIWMALFIFPVAWFVYNFNGIV